MAKYKMIDLFAGCGGLTDGFLQTEQFKEVAAVEWMKPQVETLRHRLQTKWDKKDAQDTVMHFDIQREAELFSGWKMTLNLGMDTVLTILSINLVGLIWSSEGHLVKHIQWLGVSGTRTECEMTIEIICLSIIYLWSIVIAQKYLFLKMCRDFSVLHLMELPSNH